MSYIAPVQALKKAKNFELGKLKRRMKAANGDEAAKLQEQVQAVKSADLAALTNEILAEHQWREVAQPPSRAAEAGGHKGGATDGPMDGAEAVVEVQVDSRGGSVASQIVCARLKRAKCVRDQVRPLTKTFFTSCLAHLHTQREHCACVWCTIQACLHSA
jgi:hypothetical protein